MRKTILAQGSTPIRAILGTAVLVGSLIVTVQPSLGRPGDVLNTISSPAVGAPAQQKRNIGAGDLNYASRTGAMQYNYALILPPGRVGLQPSLSISYSSQGSLRGGIASGWSMGVPMIEIDTSENSVLEMSNKIGPVGLSALATDKDLSFITSMSGGHRLVLSGESVESRWVAYRAEYDDSFTRYERHIKEGIWRARTMDGRTWYFGTGHDGELSTEDSDTASTNPELHDGLPASLIFDSDNTQLPRVSPHHQPLTRVVDAFGNTVRYFWQADFPTKPQQTVFPEELRLHSIRYTENPAAHLGSHAKVEFHYEDEQYCSAVPAHRELPIGASLNHRGYFPWYSGRKALQYVETAARDTANANFKRVRRVKLDTTIACPSNGGSSRQLKSILVLDPDPEDAGSAEPLQAAISFGYGGLERKFDAVKDFHIPASGATSSNQSNALSWGYQRKYGVDATLERSLLDMDGDGRLDLLLSGTSDKCEFTWQRNLGDGRFDPDKNTLAFPDEGLRWRDEKKPGLDEGCSLSARRTTWTNLGNDGYQTPGNHLIHRFIDMNRDGRPDLVTAIQYTPCLIADNVEGIAGENAAGIKEVFKEEWPGGLAQYGACSDISPIAVDGIVDNVCDAWNPGHNCGCAVVDQLKAKQLEDRAGPVNCEDFSEGEFGFNNHRTSQGGASWTAPQFGSCNSYPLMRNGHYPWMVYYSSATDNDGNGVKFGSGNRIWSPIPLDPASNQSGIANNAGRGLSSSNHAVLDITGDGIIDVLTLSTLVTATTVNGTDGRHWNVFPGKINDLTGEFDGFSQKPYIWLIPESARMSSSQGTLYGTEADGFTSITRSMTRLIDTNADGLPDLVRLKPDNTGFEVALNTGRSFCVNRLGEVPGTILKGEKSFDRTAYNNVLARPGAITTNPGGSTTQGPYTPISGEGKNLANLVDLDGDGLPDYYDAGDDIDLKPFKCAESAPSFFLFNGATGCSDTDYTQVTMGAGAGFRSEADGVHHYIPRDIQVGGKNDSTVWWQKSDYMDLDGDGVDDLATPNETSQYHWDLVSDDNEPGKPLRLLNAINNGHGLITEIEYHPYNDARATSNASTGKGMPTHIFVVTKIHSSSAIAEEYFPVPDGEVNIKYGDPAYTKNHRNQHGFRGFESIQTSRVHDVGATSGFSVSEQRYDYEIDWSGRMAESLTYVDGFPIGAGEPVAGISTKEWAERSLFSEATKSFHMVSGSSRNCLRDDGSFHDESGCVGYHQFAGSQVTEMRAIADSSGGDDVAWVPVATISSRRSDIDEGSKRSESDVQIFSEPTKYMLHSTEKRNYVREAGQWVLAGRTTARLDTTNTYVQYSGQIGTVGGLEVLLESKTTRDSLGLVTESQDPEDFGTSFKTTTSYSGLKVHATSVTNERGHTATVDTDYGTGQVTRALGANVLPCDTSKFEGVETYYDKLGRPTGASRRSCAGNSYHLEVVSSVEYVDYLEYDPAMPVDPVMIPAHMIATTILDADAGSASVATSFVDGAGRTLRTELGLGSDSAITISHYNSAGQIVRHQESNPSTGPGNTDEFTETVYGYDSLGRATQMRQGNNAGIGVNLSYSFRTGISKTNTFEIVSDDGPAAEKTVYSDHFGRMVQVDEKMDGGGYASTMYEFDGNDNIAKITSASNDAGVAGVVTKMVHDKAGRRTKVVRGEREWSYAYDKNGSMVRETSPNDSGESADDPAAGLYTTSTVYDVIGRPTSRLLAVNGLSNKEQKLYDVYSVGYQYDFCENGKGKLCSQQSGSTLETDYIYDWAGRVVEERQKIGVSETVFEFGDAGSQPDFTMERSSHFAYNSSGAVVEAWMPDGTDQASSTHLQYEYNEFTGAPEKLSQFMGVNKKGQPTMQELAFVTRNRAQRVVSQTTGCLTRQWEYDHLGRVTDTAVQGVGCTTQNGPILSESMQYFDSSEVKKHDVYRAGLTQRSFDYNYDSQHQLITAEDNNSYRVAFDYSPSGNGTMKSVQAEGSPHFQASQRG